MPKTQTFVIVGAGLAGAKAAEALRAKDFDGDIILFSEEDELPYERPPLSKDFLAGKKKLADFTVNNAAWYRDHAIDLRPGTRVESIDLAGHTVRVPDGSSVRYDKLLLATGSRPRVVSLPGSDAAGVHYLRRIDDAVALNQALGSAASLAVVGAGWIGLEVAANARERGIEVTIVETAPLPLLRALGSEVAEIFADLHRNHGVDLRLKTEVDAITTRDGKAGGLTLKDGTEIGADSVLVAVGAQPNIELAEQAGLTITDGGIEVDAGLRTSAPDVFAVGDIASAHNPLLNTRIRTEHWANALKQPTVAAAGMLGEEVEYNELPYFFTDQYNLGMEYVGHPAGYTKVVFRGDVQHLEFVAFWLAGDGRVLAGMNVNVWDVLDDVKSLIRSQRPVDPKALADPDSPLTQLGAG
jgi:3-phenylpropionate/trans-cinnamate dioxygenase ferredoxin reductase subunit